MANVQFLPSPHIMRSVRHWCHSVLWDVTVCGWSLFVFGVSQLVSLCSCGATASLWFPELVSWMLQKLTKVRLYRRTACCSALPVVHQPIIVLSWHVQDRESVIARVCETSSERQLLQHSTLPAVVCPVICYHHSSVFLSQLIKNRNLFHKALPSALSWAGHGEKKRRKEGKRKRKLLKSPNHERLGLGLEWFGIQGSLVLWLRG